MPPVPPVTSTLSLIFSTTTAHPPPPDRLAHTPTKRLPTYSSGWRGTSLTNWVPPTFVFARGAHRITMLKLLKRTLQVEQLAVRRKAKRAEIKARARLQDEFKNRMQSVVITNKSLVNARRRRREDWELGPLAPRRDTPIKDANGAYWGTSSLGEAMGSFGSRQRDLACRWAGGAKYLCLKAGDRAAIMQGPDKGKIGTIRTVNLDEAQVTLEAENLQVSSPACILLSHLLHIIAGLRASTKLSSLQTT